MKTSTRLYVLTCLLFCICIAGNGQTIPRSEQDIPLFPGSVRNLEAQKQTLADYKEIHAGEAISDLQISVYSAGSVADQVCRFYIEKLGAKEGFPEDNDYLPNQEINTKPWYEVSYFPNSWFEDQYEGNIKIHDGKWFKSALSERNQWKQGKWLQGAYFEWTGILNSGDLVRCSVEIIDDDSFDSRTRTVTNKTLITILSRIERSDEDMEDD